MSIYDELLYWVKNGRLFKLEPCMPGTLARRHLFVSSVINSAPWHEVRYGRLRADLDRFTSGDRIPVRMPPSKSVAAFLALLEPPAARTWEIRSTHQPQLRLLGYFAQIDIYVGLGLYERRQLATDADWKLATKDCQAEWRSLFPAYDPLGGANIHDYLSEKYFPV